MYAIIRTGGKQAKVREGDVIDVERLRGDGEVTFTPLLVVDDKGTVYSDREELKAAQVVAKVVGEGSGPKIDIFKYKAKTGYRRRQGHRQRYTTIEVTKITGPGKPKKASASKTEKPADEKPASPAKAEATEKKAPAAKTAGSKKPAAKKPAAKKPAAEKKPPAAKAAGSKKPAAKKPAAEKKPPAAKAAGSKKPAADDDSKES